MVRRSPTCPACRIRPRLNTIASPGVGSGLSGTTADIAEYTTSTPFTSYYRQWNGRLDADVTSKDRLSFAIYWVPQGNTSYNDGSRAYNFFKSQSGEPGQFHRSGTIPSARPCSMRLA